MQNFNELQIDNKLKKSISAANFKIPTAIQIKSIPCGLSGKDILGTAQTGTGKTLAFTIPMINKLILNKSSMALIICPTRELASQVMQIVLKLNVREIGIGSALLIERPEFVKGSPDNNWEDLFPEFRFSQDCLTSVSYHS